LWPVSGATHIGVPAATGKEREGERRLAGGAAHGIGHIRQRNEERGRENGRCIRLRFN
jgi:predicted Zn-dependent protease